MLHRTLALLILLVPLVQALPSVDITLIANEGFLISGESNKVLVDGIFTNGFNTFHTPPDSILVRARSATSPFDDIDAMIVSHSDGDHFNGAFVAEHLTSNTSASLISAAEIISTLKGTSSYEQFSTRILPGIDTGNAEIDTLLSGIRFRLFALRHDSLINPGGPPNIGSIFTIDNLKIFHAGDGLAHDLSAYQQLHIADEHIDIAFLPYWFLDATSGGTGREIITYIHPKAIILMHAIINKDDVYHALAESITSDSLQVYFMDSPMTTFHFVKENGRIDTITGSHIRAVRALPTSGSDLRRASKALIFPGYGSGSLTISGNPAAGVTSSGLLVNCLGRNTGVHSLRRNVRERTKRTGKKSRTPGLYIFIPAAP